MLHQGPAVHSFDFILPVFADHPFRDMHRKLAANCLAQASALMRGKSAAEVRIELQAKGLQGAALEAAIPHRVFPGDRPSNTLLMPRIDAFHRSEEHTSELQTLMRISYAVFCLKKNTKEHNNTTQLT